MLNSPIDQIKSKIDIVELIQEYIPLKKAGVNYKALCPFHSEKTPSFFVSQDKQIWHCFGCGKGGGIFDFVMEIEGIEFGDALRLLAKKAGVTLKRQDKALQTKRARLIAILNLASKYYHQALKESKAGKTARDYLKKRKIDDLTRDQFRLGFAPNLWHALSEFLEKKGYKPEEISEAGLTVKKEGEDFYDRFRNRLIFPIWDVHGNVVGLGGRTLSKDESVAKYINTPQTLVYDKSRVLYGLDKAKAEIRRKNQAIIVEGYTDVISSHRIDVSNVISSSGTALTEGQIQLIKRYTPNVVLAFDMDLAGDEATRRGIDLAISMGLGVKVASLPQSKDPDECIKKDPKIWLKTIKKAKPILDYYFDSAFSDKDINEVEDRKAISAVLLPVIGRIPDKVEQAFYIQKLAKKLGVSEDVLSDALKTQPRIKEPRYRKEETISKTEEVSEIDIVGERLLALVLVFPQYLKILDQVKESYFSPKLSPLYKNLKNYYNMNKVNISRFCEAGSYNNKGGLELNQFKKELAKISKDLVKKVDILILSAERDFSDTKDQDTQEAASCEIQDCIIRLKKLNLENQRKKIEEEMAEAEEEGDKVKVEALSKKFAQLS